MDLDTFVLKPDHFRMSTSVTKKRFQAVGQLIRMFCCVRIQQEAVNILVNLTKTVQRLIVMSDRQAMNREATDKLDPMM